MRFVLSTLLFMALPHAPAFAESAPAQHEDKEDAAAPHGAAVEQPAQEQGAGDSEDTYCGAIVDPAREQRYLLKQQELKSALAAVNERLAELEKRKADYQQWVQRREDFAKRATQSLVEIYAAMKPEASAARLSQLDPELAASLLLAIATRQSSAILNEMDEKTAAALTNIMAASARKNDPS